MTAHKRVHYQLRQKGIGEFLLLPYLVLMIVGFPIAYLHHVIYLFPGLLLTGWIVLNRGGRLCVLLIICATFFTVAASINFPLLYNRLGLESAVFQSLNLYALLSLFIFGLIVPDMFSMTKRQREWEWVLPPSND